MRLARSRRLRSVPKKTGTTAQSLGGAAPELTGGAIVGATERVVGRAAPSLSVPLLIASLLAPPLGGIGDGAGEAADGGDGDGEAADGGGGVGEAEGSPGAGSEGGDPDAGAGGATDLF